MRKILLSLLDSCVACEKGNIAITFAASAIPLIACAGIAVDFALAHMTETRMQAAADAAVLAAVVKEGTDAARREIGYESVNKQLSRYAGLPDNERRVAVTVKGDMAQVDVDLNQPALFATMIGIRENPIRVSARAKRKPGEPICMLALGETEPESIVLAGAAEIDAPDCAIYSNSNLPDAIRAQGAAQARAEKFCAAGSMGGGGNFQPAPAGNCSKIPDPLAGLPVPAAAACKAVNSFSGGVHHLTEGTYCGGLAALTHADVRLAPGVYVIKDGPLEVRAHASISGTGITMFMVGTGTFMDLQGGGSMDIAAPTSGPYRGIVIAQDPASNPGGTSVITGGGDVRIVGTLHLPTQVISLRGNGEIGATSPAWSMIAAKFTFQGNPLLSIASDFQAAGYGEAAVKTMKSVVLTE